MAKQVITLTAEFNEATVRKGQVFRIQTLPVGGGFSGAYEEFTVVSGKTQEVADPSTAHPQYGDDAFVRFKALQKGDIEIVAESKSHVMGGTTGMKTTYKVHVI